MAVSLQFMFCLPLYSFTALLMILFLTHYSLLSDSKTLAWDVKVLRSIRQSIDPNTVSSSTFIRTWDFEIDPCENPGIHFLGVLCTFPEGNDYNRITEINLEGDGLEGFLSPIIGSLTELTLLNLSKNKFRGPIPDSIINATNITSLVLSENFLSGSIPSGLRRLKRLEFLNLSKNRLSGSVPGALSSIRCLTHLILSNNQLTGRIPDMTGLWKLDTLDMSRNQLSGNLPEFPRTMRTLLLGQNVLFGHILSLHRLQHLTELDLSGNRLSGLISHYILALPEARHIDLSVNRFTDIEVRRMTNKPSQLEELDVQKNRISGHLPLNLVTFTNLTSLNLGHNLFSGEIPAQYGEMVGKGFWTRLFLNDNFLEGGVPPGLNNGTISGSLAHNCIKCSGSIPICVGRQKSPVECIGLS